MVEKNHLVRIPQQKRSIEKKVRIVEAAYQVFGQKGYSTTTTPDIARQAGLSTGTVYAYFTDKKELFLECFKKYGMQIQERLLANYETLSSENFFDLIERTISILIDINNVEKSFHKEAMALTYLNPDVQARYFEQHERVANTIVSQLVQRGLITQHGREKIFLAVSLIESISRELTYNPGAQLDRETLISLIKRAFITFMDD